MVDSTSAAAPPAPPAARTQSHTLTWDGTTACCSCGLRCGSKLVWALHAEQEDAPPLGPSYWSSSAEATVPLASLAQPGVISKNAFAQGHSLTLWLAESACPEQRQARLRGAVATFLRWTEQQEIGRAVGLLALSKAGLDSLGAQSSDRCPPFTTKLHCDTEEPLLPATGGDILLWVKAQDGTAFPALREAVLAELGELVARAEEVSCARRPGGKDLTGFCKRRSYLPVFFGAATTSPKRACGCCNEQTTAQRTST